MKSTQMYVVTGTLFTTLAAGLFMQSVAQESIKLRIPSTLAAERGGSGIGKQETPKEPNPVGKDIPNTDDFSTWCGQVRPILIDAWEQASDAFHESSNGGQISSTRASWTLLYQGLEAALARASGLRDSVSVKQSISWRLIDRGLRIADKLKETYLCEGIEGTGCVKYHQANEMILDFLRAYYNHTDTSLIRLDSEYLTGVQSPWLDLAGFDRQYLDIIGHFKTADSVKACLMNPASCSGRYTTMVDHQTRYVAYARNQLNWLNKFALAKGSMNDIVDGTETRSPIYVSAHDVRFYMILAESIMGSVKEELVSTIYANRFACLIERLDRLQSRVGRYLAPTGAITTHAAQSQNAGVQAISTGEKLNVENLNRVASSLELLVNDIQTLDCTTVRQVPQDNGFVINK